MGNPKPNDFRGVTLIEVMMVIAIISVVCSIALPHYMRYLGRAKAVACLANRYHAEQEYVAFEARNRSPLPSHVQRARELLGKEFPVLSRIDRLGEAFHPCAHAALEDFLCPLGGIYTTSPDPDDPERIRIICSIHGGIITPRYSEKENSSNILFQSDFDELESTNPLSGKWRVNEGSLAPDEKEGVEHRLSFGENTWKDFELRTNVTLLSGSGYGVYYRGDGEKDITSYIFQYDPGYGSGEFIVRKVYKGKEDGPFQRTPIPDGFPVYYQSHEILIIVLGDKHVIYIDGQIILSFSDDTFGQGSAGFRTWNRSQVAFDDVAVFER